MRVLLFLLFLFFSLNADDYIDASDSSIHDIQQHYLIFEDKSTTLELKDILSKKNQKEFRLLNGASSGFGLSKSDFWIKLPLHNPKKDVLQRLLYFEYPLLDEVTLYTKNSDGSYEKTVSGDSIPISLHQKKDENILFSLSLKPQTKKVFYIHIKSKSSMDLRLLLLDEAQYYKKTAEKNTIIGLFYGAALIMILYNLFIYFAIRDKAYLYYVVFQTVGILTLFSLSGLSFKFLWPELPYLNNHLLTLLMTMTYILTIAFTRVFLDTKRYLPREDKILKSLLVIYTFAIIPVLYMEYHSSLLIAVVIIFTSMITLIIVGMLAFFKYKVRAARYYLLAWLLLILFNLLFLLKKIGLIDNSFITIWGAEIGVVLELLLLSFGLADRFNVMRNEKEKLQKEAIEKADILANVLKRSKNELEQKVKERTVELSLANNDLQKSLITVKLLFKELHHRVKNNIQITISIMLLQKKRAKEKAVHSIIDDNTMRLQSISTIHELLYKDNDISIVYMRKYINALLFSYQQNTIDTQVSIVKDIDSFRLDMDSAITVGLIFNELLTNICKHAFTHRSDNCLIIRCKEKNNIVTLSIKDNGIGFDKNRTNKDTLGLLLIEDLCLKLDNAKTSYKKWHGSYFKLEFTNENNNLNS